MLQQINDWLAYLETLPSGFATTNLEHVKLVAAKLQTLTFTCPVITIAGTNGKGSCVAFLDTIFLAAGYKTVTYTSPHIIKYNERIRLNGRDVDDNSLCRAFAAVEQARTEIANTNKPISLSYFEFTTITALYLFKEYKPDVIILEAGLGGRLDAVNIIDNDIAIITTISLDHTQLLGKTREAIGKEKSGIMRARKPIICGDFDPPETIYHHATAIHAQLYCVNKNFTFTATNHDWQWQYNDKILCDLPLPRLPLQNAATALMAIYLLQQKLPVSLEFIRQGLSQAFLLGRLQTIKINNIAVILDVAHNPESTALLAKNLATYHNHHDKTLAIASMLKDKDIAASLQPLTNIIDKWFIAALDVQRAASQQQLYEGLLINKVSAEKIQCCSDIPDALQQAIASAKKNDRIVVFGSFYVIVKILKSFGPVDNSLS